MKILHTSDWHLGHTLHEVSRETEHDAFLAWLLGTIEKHDVDALIVTGDVFDSSNPPATAQRTWYRFLVEAGRRRPGLRVVAIAGNHDSAGRLEAPREVLAALQVTVVGELPTVEGELDAERLLVPLVDRSGAKAWVAAVPYLRAVDLAAFGGSGDAERSAEVEAELELEANDASGGDGLTVRIRNVYARASALLRARRGDGEATILTGHLYAAGSNVSDLSERKIQRGNQEVVPHDAFGDEHAYVALGHLHLPQTVGKRENVRYAGSPIPLSLDEADYPHQVVLVELDGGRTTRIETIRVPRTVDILRLPAGGSAPLAEVVRVLKELPPDPDPGRRGADLRPFLAVRLLVDTGEPGWRAEIEAAVEGKDARLLRIDRTSTGSGKTAIDQTERSLSEVTPEEVFRMKYASAFERELPDELLAAFRELLAEAGETEETGARA